MKTIKELYDRWDLCKKDGQLLVDHTHPLRMYLNISERSNKELLIPVDGPMNWFESTLAIRVDNYKINGQVYFSIELLEQEYDCEFASLCLDLFESSRTSISEKDARNKLFETLKKWYFLLSQERKDILSDNEIKGLIGEVQFIIDSIKSGIDGNSVVEAWKTHKDASRDFVFDNTWTEVKTIEATKEYITISSIEQLDQKSEGSLYVYKIVNDATGFSLNAKIKELKNMLGFQAELELNKKLISKGYSQNEKYENKLFTIVENAKYSVNDTFPRIIKEQISSAIIRSKYDIKLSAIEEWKIL